MALTVLDVKNAKPKTKNYVLRDERGLYLEVSPKGGKWWRLRYSFDGKENRMSLGTYPDISLKDARERRDEARTMIAKGIDPARKRRTERLEASGAHSLENVSREWAKKFAHTWTEGHAELTLRWS